MGIKSEITDKEIFLQGGEIMKTILTEMLDDNSATGEYTLNRYLIVEMKNRIDREIEEMITEKELPKP